MMIYNKISNYYFIKQYVFVVFFNLSIRRKSHKSSFRYFIPYAPIIRIIFLCSKLLFIFKTVPATFFDSFLFGRKKVSLQKTLAIAAATRCR